MNQKTMLPQMKIWEMQFQLSIIIAACNKKDLMFDSNIAVFHLKAGSDNHKCVDSISEDKIAITFTGAPLYTGFHGYFGDPKEKDGVVDGSDNPHPETLDIVQL